MEQVAFLSLGSIIILRGTVKKLSIAQRGVQLPSKDGGAPRYFDYGAILYPEGLVEDQLVYFNHEQILKVIFEGYRDEDDALIVGELNRILKTLDEDGAPDPFASLREE
ncbi:DUF4176 domain-containing protein [Latilactobacillus fuchuensis]|uniref:DUF4176 domain-containing protein n=1 Tax=Latilactobacillus fuchuensis TaxID=164393 RepID=UPI0020C76B57|nr:DUF4176 domain-containing protein [Latilactobacillus fuchuensis]MCP8857190.1 DUF4176 domain-containing protein [Latilactobacillus fuchuensis]